MGKPHGMRCCNRSEATKNEEWPSAGSLSLFTEKMPREEGVVSGTRPYRCARKVEVKQEQGFGEALRWVGLPTAGMTQLENDKQMPTYSIGETIRVELDLHDQSGVLTVKATFYETESGHDFSMRGDGRGQAEVMVVLMEKVTDKTLPGEYRCKDVTVYDTHYNYTTFAPDIRFRVENDLGDHEGPKLVVWRVSKQ
jgi:hypothetical protein